MHQIENGVYPNMPNSIYHSSQGLSRSALMKFKQSPWHYWFHYLNPDKPQSLSSDAMKVGELVHALVLEPMYFNERYIVKPVGVPVPKCELKRIVGAEEYAIQKAAREEAQQLNEEMTNELLMNAGGKEIVSRELYNEANAYADSVLRESIAQALFIDVKVEHSIYFTHKLTGLQCKVRPDAWAGSIVTDLKTCKDASYSAFESAAYRGGYFIQAAMIKQALESIGIHLEKFIFYCVEKSPGAPCVYYPVDDESMERAENDFNNLMYDFHDHMIKNAWESYEPRNLTYPSWAK